MLQNIGTAELVIITIVLFIMFGSKKLPEFARGFREASEEFRKALQDDDEPKSRNRY